MLIGTFMWFGTAAGTALRRYAADRAIPLAWAFNPTIAAECGVGPQPPPAAGCTDWGPVVPRPLDAVAVRLLDPIVLQEVPEGHNVTVGNATREHFELIWKKAADALAPDKSFVARISAAKSLWADLILPKGGDGGAPGVASLAVEPLYAAACSSEDCVGVRVVGQHCICAPPQSSQALLVP